MRTYEQVVVKRSLSPATRTNGTANGTAVDLGPSGGESAVVAFVTGTMTDGTHTASIEEADASGGPWTAIPAARLTGSSPVMTSTDGNTQFEVGVAAAKEFMRAVIVTTGATTGGITSAVIVIGEPDRNPPVRT